MTAAVDRAIEQAYVAFAGVPRPVTLDGHPLLLEEVDAPTLLETPLRRLTVEQLDRYAFRATTTVGTDDDFRYYWPRLMELSWTSWFSTDIEVLYEKLANASWWNWPAAEQKAIEDFVTAVSETWRVEPFDSDLPSLDDWVCAFGQFVADISPILTPLLADTKMAKRNLRSLISYNMRDLKRGRLRNVYWKRHPDHSRNHPAWVDAPLDYQPEGNPNYRVVLAFLTEAWQTRRRQRRVPTTR